MAAANRDFRDLGRKIQFFVAIGIGKQANKTLPIAQVYATVEVARIDLRSGQRFFFQHQHTQKGGNVW